MCAGVSRRRGRLGLRSWEYLGCGGYLGNGFSQGCKVISGVWGILGRQLRGRSWGIHGEPMSHNIMGFHGVPMGMNAVYEGGGEVRGESLELRLGQAEEAARRKTRRHWQGALRPYLCSSFGMRVDGSSLG